MSDKATTTLDATNDKRLAFVVGFPRSGTTLLAGLLNSHSKICASPETQFYTQAMRCNRFRKSDYAPQALKRIYTSTRLSDLNIEPSKIEFLVNDSHNSLTDFFANLLNTYSERKKSCSIIVEKSPDHIKYLPQIINDFPRSKIIAITRDPRAAISSLTRTTWNHRSTLNASLEFRFQMKQLSLFRDKAHILRYEDLVTDPQATLKSICNYLKIRYQVEMVENGSGHQIIPTWENEWKKNSKGKPTTDSLNKWEKHLSRHEVKMIEKFNWDFMKQQSYTTYTSTTIVERFTSDLLSTCYNQAKSLKTLIEWFIPPKR